MKKKPFKIVSLETLLLIAGVAYLIYGIATQAMINIFWGVVIIPGVFILIKVKQKDWQAHWSELEQQRVEKNINDINNKE
jgi:amino acid permease